MKPVVITCLALLLAGSAGNPGKGATLDDLDRALVHKDFPALDRAVKAVDPASEANGALAVARARLNDAEPELGHRVTAQSGARLTVF